MPKPGVQLTAQEIAQWCAERLTAMKVPRFVLFVDDLPHTPTHKVAKQALKSDPTLNARAVDLHAKEFAGSDSDKLLDTVAKSASQ